MSQKAKLKRLLSVNEGITVDKAKSEGIKNPRQQVYFLRQEGNRIINPSKETYKMIDR